MQKIRQQPCALGVLRKGFMDRAFIFGQRNTSGKPRLEAGSDTEKYWANALQQ